VAELPLLRRFPALKQLPRAALGTFPTPVERVVIADHELLVKRDDRTGRWVGGNKVRGLEWLLGDVQPGDRVLTVGPSGSTHALATAVCARELGACTTVIRWNQEMNPAARSVAARLRSAARIIDAQVVPAAYLLAGILRARHSRWIPAGGASPAALLGHVNAALELVEQVERGECEMPERVVVPLGTGGTSAGLTLGFKIAQVPVHVVAVRVVPRLVGRIGRVIRLGRKTATLIESFAHESVPRVEKDDVTVDDNFYAGAYGRALASKVDETSIIAAGIRLDDTYSRKAFAAALAQNRRTLFWLTFDGRLLQD
jgi:D-cysteine desulfhydrase